MNYQGKLQMFMRLKRDVLGDLQGYDNEDKPIEDDFAKYCTDKDIEDIVSWSDKESERIFREISGRITKIKQFGRVSGCFANSCPHCLFHYLECDFCSFRKRHGKCDNDNSHWSKYLEKSKISNDQYKAIIKTIEEADDAT